MVFSFLSLIYLLREIYTLSPLSSIFRSFIKISQFSFQIIIKAIKIISTNSSTLLRK